MYTKGRPPVVPLLLFLFLFQTLAPGWAFEAGAQTGDYNTKGVVITEVLPYARGGGLETEYVQIYNPGPDDYIYAHISLCDEHVCAVVPSMGHCYDCWLLRKGDSIYFAQNGTIFLSMKGFPPTYSVEGYTKGSRNFSETSKWPAMLNDGDYLWLKDMEGTIVDVVAVGRDYQGTGWTGGPGPEPRIGWSFVREFRLEGTKRVYQDTNSSADWPVYRTRRAELTALGPFKETRSAQLTALRLPDDGAVLANLFEGSSSEILLNTYEFTSFSMGKVLSDRAKSGVKVKVILEGHPVGGISSSETNIIRMLTESSCEVKLIWSNTSTDRYYHFGLDHAKYMVLDNSTAIVISENFVPSALGTVSSSANRGWGFSLKENATTQYLKRLFDTDWGSAVNATKVLPKGAADWNRPPGEAVLVPRAPMIGTTFDGAANITALVSPDTTEDLLLNIINGAQERLYIEQLTFDLNWHLQSGVTQTQKSPLLLAVIEAARRGVDVKVLVDGNFLDTNDNDAVVNYINEVGTAEGLKLQARIASIPNITTVHNKGIVADELVLVSSINWVDSAVRDNREVGLAVQMEGLDTLYVSYFMKDWDPQALPPDDGPTPPTREEPTSVYLVCGSMLAFIACGLVIIALTKKRRV
jgi:cardiolipin synthase